MAAKMTVIDYNKIYKSMNCGEYIIKEELETADDNGKRTRMVKIEFLLTKTIKSVPLHNAIYGNVYDPYYPSVYGVACLGEYDKSKHIPKIQTMWRGMLSRCINKNSGSYKSYGGIGVTVCERWLCYEYFLNDIQHISGYDEYIESINNGGQKYQLDKDLLQQNIPINKRIYSPETCCFIPAILNSSIMAKERKNNRSSKYYGVIKNKNSFISVMEVNKKRMNLGTYKDEIEAAVAYNNFVYTLPDVKYRNLNEFIIAKVVENKKEENNIIFAKVVK